MIRATLFILSILIVAPSTALAQQALVADLDTHQIAIRSTFTGTELLLFGAIEAPAGESLSDKNRGDVVLVIRGPDSNVTVRKKDRLGPIWANKDAVTFSKVPGFYAMLSTRPVHEIAPPSLQRRHDLGIETILEKAIVRDSQTDLSADDFRAALMRTREADRLYQEDNDGFLFISGKLFRARVALPANVPVGTYQVEAYLIRDGHVAGAQFSPLFVDKVGIERQIFRFAHHYEWLYGLLSVLLAALAGYAASLIFREE